MEQFTKLVEGQIRGQQPSAAQACLHAAKIQASIDARGRALAEIFCERLSRSVN